MLQRRRRWSGRATGAIAVCSLIILGAIAWPFAKAHLQAVALLRIVSGQPVPGIIKKLVTGPVRTQDVNFATGAGVVRGRLYLPIGHPDVPGLVVLHGVHHLGIDEPRLESFATAMAGCGLRVLTPELPGIKDYHVSPGSVRVIEVGEVVCWPDSRLRGSVRAQLQRRAGAGRCCRPGIRAGLQVRLGRRLAG